MARKGQHVVPNSKGWAVRKSGASRASKVFRTQAEAVAAATKIAKTQKSEVYIHGKNGRIRERKSYGNDPRSRKG